LHVQRSWYKLLLSSSINSLLVAYNEARLQAALVP